MVSDIESFAEGIMLNDRAQFYEDLKLPGMDYEQNGNVYPVIADFTEYSPLHNGHLHCMNEARRLHPGALFVAVIPGLFERNGRGLPYILTRQMRARLAVDAGADIVVEGPPMGVMGSGQYSLCLALMFKALNADFIPRGYISCDPKFKIILDYINKGKAVAPRPYKIILVENKEVLLEGKLHNDDYVIVSLSKSLNKVNFDFENKFIFIPRLKNISGTAIREQISRRCFDNLDNMLPSATISMLKDQISKNKAPLDRVRCERLLLGNVNNMDGETLRNLALMDDKTAANILEGRPFGCVDELDECITYGFSTHRKQRILSVLESCILNNEIHKYISNYPQKIRILGYKNKEVLNKFKINLKNNSIRSNRIKCR